MIKIVKIIPFLAIVAFASCTSKTIKTRDFSFSEPETIIEKAYYHAMKPLVFSQASLLDSNQSLSQIGLERIKLQSSQLLTDLGGKTFSINGTDAIYLDPNLSRKQHFNTYAKWKTILKQPKQSKLAEATGVNFDGDSLTTLFSLPKNVRQLHKIKKSPKALLYFPAYDHPSELDIRSIFTFLMRGFHVLVVNYREDANNSPIPDWKVTCQDAECAMNWILDELRISAYDTLIYGKSFGSAPAIYVASKHKGTNVILDEPFSRLSEACAYTNVLPIQNVFNPLYRSFIEHYYRFPNEDWIRKVSGEILIIRSMGESQIGSQTDKLLEALVRGKSEQEAKEFRLKHLLKVHSSVGVRDSWHSDENAQERITSFIGNTF